MEVSGQLHAPAALAPGTDWIGSWVDPRAVLDAVVKRKIPSPRRESNTTGYVLSETTSVILGWNRFISFLFNAAVPTA
jgi:hypothetical protein